MGIDLGVMCARINLITSGFDRGVKKVRAGFTGMGQKAMHLNQTLELVGRGFRAFEKATKGTFGTFIEAADTAEKYRVTLDILLGSQKEGARMFQEMSKFAAKVPFEYEKIMSSATALAGVMEGGVEEVNEWMPMISDLAAVSRLSIEETTGQIIRMYSAGAAAADLFRERGITAMLGFQAGVRYTAEETREMLTDAFESPTSKFRGASKELAKTWSGLLSMMADRWFLFRNKVMGGGLFEGIKQKVQEILDKLDELQNNGKMAEFVTYMRQGLTDTINLTIKGIGFILKGWHSIKVIIAGVMLLHHKFSEFLAETFVSLETTVDRILAKLKLARNESSGTHMTTGKINADGSASDVQQTSKTLWNNKAAAEAAKRQQEYWNKVIDDSAKAMNTIENVVEFSLIELSDKVSTANIDVSSKIIPNMDATKLDIESLAAAYDKLLEPQQQLNDLITDATVPTALAEINRQYSEMIAKGGAMGAVADRWRENAIATQEYADMCNMVKEVTDSMVSALTDAFVELAKTGKMNLKALGQALVEELQLMAAQKAAALTMEAVHASVMAIISLIKNDGNAGQWGTAAAKAAAGAASMGGFVAGSGLSGMAHDGISSIPEDGTWLLKKNERVIDSDTNADLKAFLSNQGGAPKIAINKIEINNSDEEGVMNALPEMKRIIIETVTGDISANGAIIQTTRQRI